jgi:hypothetical protein
MGESSRVGEGEAEITEIEIEIERKKATNKENNEVS